MISVTRGAVTFSDVENSLDADFDGIEMPRPLKHTGRDSTSLTLRLNVG